MGLGDWLRSWWADDVTPAIKKEEAIDHAKRHAEVNHLEFSQPVHVRIEKHWIDPRDPSKGRRAIYLLALGSHRPMPFVEVDGADGTILAWRTLPRQAVHAKRSAYERADALLLIVGIAFAVGARWRGQDLYHFVKTALDTRSDRDLGRVRDLRPAGLHVVAAEQQPAV